MSKEILSYGQVQQGEGSWISRVIREWRFRHLANDLGGILSREQLDILADSRCKPDWVVGSSAGQVPYNTSPEGMCSLLPGSLHPLELAEKIYAVADTRHPRVSAANPAEQAS